MSSFNNIDELLKSSFKDFAPETPDVWSQVSQQIPSTPPAANAAAGSKIATVIKSASITTKIVTALAIPATFVGAYVGYKYINSDKEKELETKPQTEVMVSSPESKAVPLPNYADIKEENKPVIEPITDHKSARDHAKMRRGDDTNANKMKSIISDLPPSEPVIMQTPLTQEKSKPEVNNTTSTDAAPAKPLVTTSQAKADDNKKQVEKEPVESTTSAASNSNLDDDQEPFIPNVFTPDGDGINDVFMIPIENETQYAIKILNRNNEVVFESNNKNVVWDGINMRNGQPCESGLYTYTFRYQYKNGKSHVKSGKIQLNR